MTIKMNTQGWHDTLIPPDSPARKRATQPVVAFA